MSSELQRKLYSLEVEPPVSAWARIADALDEINTDNSVAAKLANAEVNPAVGTWQKISQLLYPAPATRPIVRRLAPYAMAAILVGLIIGVYFLYFNKQTADEIVIAPPPIEKNEPITTIDKGDSVDVDKPVPSDIKQPASDTREIYAVNKNQIPKPRNRNIDRNVASSQPPVSSELEGKTFNQPLDDLSFVASNSGYMTMVNADGRLVKIPEKYSTIAPYLQDKNEYPEYLLDILMDADSYWKNKVSQWRQKLAESNVAPSYDGFFEFINLLKSIQDN